MLIQQFPKQLQQQLQQLPYFSSAFSGPQTPTSLSESNTSPHTIVSSPTFPTPSSPKQSQKKSDRKKKKKKHNQDSNSQNDNDMSKPSPNKKRAIDHLLSSSDSISNPNNPTQRSFNVVHTDSKFTTKQNIFTLWEQPEENQRKAYKNENRYILPNPLTISLIKPGQQVTDQPSPFGSYNLPPLKDCKVSVRLVHGNGEELEDGKSHILEGQTEKPLSGSENDFEKKAEFSLKVLETSGRSKFRLLFTITFAMDGYQCEETILSNPFKVISNKKKNASANTTKPKLSDLIPKQGPCGDSNEVWIRGNFFTDRATMTVKFGDREARITETEENIITCIAPPLPHLTQDTTVQVTVSNIHPSKGALISARPLYYRYVVNLDSMNSAKPYAREQQTFENLPGPFDHMKNGNGMSNLGNSSQVPISAPSHPSSASSSATTASGHSLESIMTMNPDSLGSHHFPKASRGKMSLNNEDTFMPFQFNENSLGGLGLSNPSLFPLGLSGNQKPEELNEMVNGAVENYYRPPNF